MGSQGATAAIVPPSPPSRRQEGKPILPDLPQESYILHAVFPPPLKQRKKAPADFRGCFLYHN